MSEFANRIDSQRKLLKIVNTTTWPKEPLLSLSLNAINRFASSNQIAEDAELITLLKQVSGKLFFLANKSQEQVTDDYHLLTSEVASLSTKILAALETPYEVNV